MLQQEKLMTKKEELNLTAIVEEHTAIYAELALLKENKLTVSGNDPILVHADSDLLSLIIRNLLDNAIKNSVKGKEIRVSLARENDRVVLQISNAISAAGREKLQKVKELFEGNQNWEPGEKGMGMGLKMVKMAAQKMNAVLKVDTDEKNVTFGVYFS
jgi:signal transduction histidine kinase